MKALYRGALFSAAFLATFVAGSAYCLDDPRTLAFAAEIREAAETPIGTQVDLVALELGRKLGMFTAATPQDFVIAVDAQRTDQHLTASSSIPGALANLEKPGIADLLSLAIERGALTETTNGTNVTFSTTPYAIRTALGQEDTPEAWRTLRSWRRVSTSATFSSDDVNEGDFSSLVGAEVKFVAIGNRSARDAVLLKDIADTLNEALLAPAIAKGNACSNFFNTPFGQTFNTTIALPFDTWLSTATPRTPAVIAGKLDEVVQIPSTPLDDDTTDKLRACVAKIGALGAAIQLDLAQVKEMTQKYLDALPPNQLSFAGMYTRDPESPYKTFKVLYGRDRGPTGYSINANAEVNLNDRSRSMSGLELERVRDYSVELGASSPKPPDGRSDHTFSLKWYLPETAGAKDVITAQAKLNIRVTGTFAVPLALTYANQELTATGTGTNELVKKGWQLDFGVSALLDHLLANSLAR